MKEKPFKKYEDQFNKNIPRYMHPLKNISSLSLDVVKVMEDLESDGFSVIRFPEEDFDAICELTVTNLVGKFDFESKKLDPSISLRIQDGLDLDSIRKIACNEYILKLLSDVYGRQAFPFQTLNFPMGTQQIAHSDHVHFDSLPHDFMAGAWVAMEDIGLEQGPLFYYPGSHKWPRLNNQLIGCNQQADSTDHYGVYPLIWEEMAKKAGIEKKVFTAKKGDCLIWSASLVHGGLPQTDMTKTRWSQVTHYFFEDCAYFTPVVSNEFFNKIHWRTPKNIFTGENVESKLFGESILQKNMMPDFSDFNSTKYLELNPDVKEANINPFEHFLVHGIKEGRNYKE